MSLLRYLVLIIILLPTGCASRNSTTLPHVCRYQKVQEQISFVDHYGWMLKRNDGREHVLKVQQPSRELDLLLALDNKITALNYASQIKEKSVIVATGELSLCNHPPEQQAATAEELARSCLHNTDDHRYRNFVLEKWHLKKPFYEAYHDEYPNESAWKITRRTTLQAADFNRHWLAGKKIQLKPGDWEHRVR